MKRTLYSTIPAMASVFIPAAAAAKDTMLAADNVQRLWGLLPKDWEFSASLSILIIGLVVACLVWLGFRFVMPRFTRATKTSLDDSIMTAVSGPLSKAAFTIAVWMAIESLPKALLAEPWINFIQKSVFVVIVMFIFVAGMKANRRFFDHLGDRAREDHPENEAVTLLREFYPLLRKLVAILLFIMALIAILKAFNQDVYSLVTALGVGSLAIGLAAQETLSNMFAGLTILIDRQVKPGDRIKLSDGTFGDVLDIGLRSTKVINFERNAIIIPNKTLVGERMINYSYPTEMMRGRVTVGVAYGSDIEKVLAILLEEAGKLDDIAADPAPWSYFNDFGDSSLNCMVNFYTNRYASVFDMEGTLRINVYKRLNAEGIGIPFPMRTLDTNKPLPIRMVFDEAPKPPTSDTTTD